MVVVVVVEGHATRECWGWGWGVGGEGVKRRGVPQGLAREPGGHPRLWKNAFVMGRDQRHGCVGVFYVGGSIPCGGELE